MKNFKLIISVLFLLFAFCHPLTLPADEVSKKLQKNVNESLLLFKEKDPDIKSFFTSAYGYAIFPKVAKGGIGIGGATGKGVVFEKGTIVGTARLIQVNIGLQLGGQIYSEIIFFKTKKDFLIFKKSKLRLSAQVSAVAAASGASANAKYSHGVAIFTIARSGLMYEATIGGQRFKYKKL